MKRHFFRIIALVAILAVGGLALSDGGVFDEPSREGEAPVSERQEDAQAEANRVPNMDKRSVGVKGIMSEQTSLVFPVDEYVSRRTYKGFGEYIDDGRFLGYHVADDIEFVDKTDVETPVVAIGDGEVVLKEFVSGYGGLIKIEHVINGESVTALYGHVDVATSPVFVGETVKQGAFIANLGDHKSEETDGRRKHLHFGLYTGNEARVQGYEKRAEDVLRWLNPSDVFAQSGLDVHEKGRRFDPNQEVGGAEFPISFMIPPGYDIEFVPQIDALNMYRVTGAGSARERSVMFIRYFDANRFLTLPTVHIFSEEDLNVGSAQYTARRYDIEKNPDVSDFVHQPAWRNERHVVTDVRAVDGFTRYFVLAKNPAWSDDTYEAVLSSLSIDSDEIIYP